MKLLAPLTYKHLNRLKREFGGWSELRKTLCDDPPLTYAEWSFLIDVARFPIDDTIVYSRVLDEQTEIWHDIHWNFHALRLYVSESSGMALWVSACPLNYGEWERDCDELTAPAPHLRLGGGRDLPPHHLDEAIRRTLSCQPSEFGKIVSLWAFGHPEHITENDQS